MPLASLIQLKISHFNVYNLHAPSYLYAVVHVLHGCASRLLISLTITHVHAYNYYYNRYLECTIELYQCLSFLCQHYYKSSS